MAIACGLLPVVAMAIAWPLSRAGGFIPDCMPFVDGCASVSRAARHGAANVAFKAIMLPCAALQALHWGLAARWVESRGGGEAPGIRRLGLLAGVALAVYATFLGSEGWAYGWMRRYGINFYFAGSFLAMVLFLRHLREAGRHRDFGRALMGLCWLMLGLGLASALLPAFGLHEDAIDRIQNAMEWQLGALFTLWFLVHAALYRRDARGEATRRPS